MSAVGTWAWAETTGGRLSRWDRVELLRQGVTAQLAQLPKPWRHALLGENSSIDLPIPPDSAAGRLAEERVRETAAPELYAHCLRTWAFAALFARRDSVQHDPVLLYLACVLHDLGLAKTPSTDDPVACFAVEGAREALELLQSPDLSVDEQRARNVAEAISLHMNVSVPLSMGAEAHLLSKAATLDTVGHFVAQLPVGAVKDVVARWPRDSFGSYLSATIGLQARVRPNSRAAFLANLGFMRWTLANPIDRVTTAATTTNAPGG